MARTVHVLCTMGIRALLSVPKGLAPMLCRRPSFTPEDQMSFGLITWSDLVVLLAPARDTSALRFLCAAKLYKQEQVTSNFK